LSVIRRTRVVPARLRDEVLPTYDPYRHMADRFLLTRHGSPAFIADSHFGSAYVQAGSVAGDSVYFVYPKAYTRVHGASAAPLGWFDAAYNPGRIDRVLTGSCLVRGSPGGYTLVTVKGDL